MNDIYIQSHVFELTLFCFDSSLFLWPKFKEKADANQGGVRGKNTLKRTKA